MGDVTSIAWTDHTFNPWIGCTKVSEGCRNCYAEAMDKRWGHDSWGPGRPRRRTSPANWRKPLKWDRAAVAAGVRSRVFCASQADVFDPEAPPGAREDLWDLIRATPNLDWQILTKRPENVADMAPADGLPGNVWLGTSIENNAVLDDRFTNLVDAPLRRPGVRFLSCEPLLEDIAPRLEQWLANREFGEPVVQWVIVGGESGPRHRPMDLDWARNIRDACRRQGVAFFFKQVGGRFPESNGHLLDGREYREWPGAGEIREAST